MNPFQVKKAKMLLASLYYTVFRFTLSLTLRCFLPGDSLFSVPFHKVLLVSWHFKEAICCAHNSCAFLIKLQSDEMVIVIRVAI